jgi:hypothetical protein
VGIRKERGRGVLAEIKLQDNQYPERFLEIHAAHPTAE